MTFLRRAWIPVRGAMRLLGAEHAHQFTLWLLERLPPAPLPEDDLRLQTRAFGLRFPNPLGLAAGFDKDARVADPMLRLGFGFVEVGSTTPLAQIGNPRPRVFRLRSDKAIINRLGFNNEGHDAARARLIARGDRPGIIGVNIGANKDSANRIDDYVRGIHRFFDVASYFTVNVSSPNTVGLRDMQARATLDPLLGRVVDARDQLALTGAPSRPILLKIAPDVSLSELDDIVAVSLKRRIDGLVIGNTTVSRPQPASGISGREAGGLSGAPLFPLSTALLAQAYRRVGTELPLVGVGGISSGEHALAKIRAGATLLQLYTGLVYEGPALIGDIKTRLLESLETDQPLADQIGRDCAAIPWTGR